MSFYFYERRTTAGDVRLKLRRRVVSSAGVCPPLIPVQPTKLETHASEAHTL